MYADDLQIYTHFIPTNVNTAVEGVNRDLYNIVECINKRGLEPDKTQPIVICYSRHFKFIDMNDIHHITVTLPF